MTSLPPRLTELTTSPEACDAAWKTCDSLPLSAPANRMAMNVTPAFPVMSAATATLTSAAVRPSALIALLKSALELWPRNCSPFMLSFWRVTPPNVLGRIASRLVSWLGSAMLGRAPLAAAAALWDGATLGSGDGEADGATEAAAAGAGVAVGAGVAEPPQATTRMAMAAEAASGPTRRRIGNPLCAFEAARRSSAAGPDQRRRLQDMRDCGRTEGSYRIWLLR